MKRMDLSNSRNLKTTPNFEGIPNLERLEFTGCINLLQVHPSIGLLEKLMFLSLRNCCSLVSFHLHSSLSRLCSLRVLHLSGCTKLEMSPNLKGAVSLEYLDMDRCTSLSMVHESIGDHKMLKFLSLRDCTNLVGLPICIKSLSSLITLDLCGCSVYMIPPSQKPPFRVRQPFPTQSLITLDLSFCNVRDVPCGIQHLMCLERLNLQGNNFVELPSTICSLYRLAYLNLSHCSKLKHLPELPSVVYSESTRWKGGRYFETTSESRDHRSGMYIFNCPLVDVKLSGRNGYKGKSITKQLHENAVVEKSLALETMLFLKWLQRLVREPSHFRCGFDIVCPWHWEDDDDYLGIGKMMMIIQDIILFRNGLVINSRAVQ